jgi:hypothetical protein
VIRRVLQVGGEKASRFRACCAILSSAFVLSIVDGWCIGVLPILIYGQKQHERADAQIIPCRGFQFEIAIQKRIDQREKLELRTISAAVIRTQF